MEWGASLALGCLAWSTPPSRSTRSSSRIPSQPTPAPAAVSAAVSPAAAPAAVPQPAPQQPYRRPPRSRIPRLSARPSSRTAGPRAAVSAAPTPAAVPFAVRSPARLPAPYPQPSPCPSPRCRRRARSGAPARWRTSTASASPTAWAPASGSTRSPRRATRASPSSRPSCSARPCPSGCTRGTTTTSSIAGVPSSIATGLLLGGVEGMAISGLQWQLTGNGGPDTWKFHTWTSVTFVTATVGGVGGWAFGEWLRPDPRSLALISSGAGWGAAARHPLRVGRRQRRLEERRRGLGLRRLQRRDPRGRRRGDGLRAVVADPQVHVARRSARHPGHDPGLPLLHRQRAPTLATASSRTPSAASRAWGSPRPSPRT